MPTGAAADFATTNAADCIINLACAKCGLPGERHLRDELEDRGRGAQDEGCRWPLPVVGRPAGRAFAADGLSGGGVGGHADIAAGGAYAIAFGDFRAVGTTERPDLRILRDPFSAKPNVLYASQRVGGDITDYAAIKLLKIAVS